MASQQVETKGGALDSTILNMTNKELSSYIQSNSNFTQNEITKKFNTKKTRRFAALDCTQWTRDRINGLHSDYRRLLVEQYKLNTDSQLSDEEIEIYINPTQEQSEQRQQIIDKILKLIPVKPEFETKPDTKPESKPIAPVLDERALAIHNGNHESKEDNDDDADVSSVSTHASMPSLMSDDESDDSESDGDTDSSEDGVGDIAFENEEKANTIKAIKAPKNGTKGNKQTKNGTKKEDDWGDGLFDAAKKKRKKGQNKGKKKQKKKGAKAVKKVSKKSAKKKTPSAPIQNNGNKPEMNGKSDTGKVTPKAEAKEVVQIEPKMEENKEFGYHIRPNEIVADKNSIGNIFVCIGFRKEAADLSKYYYMKCWISLKNKLRKKGKKKPYHFAVLIDFRKMSDSEREIIRETLQNGFENVLSFNLSAKNDILSIEEDGKETNYSFDKAMMEYPDEFTLKKVNQELKAKEVEMERERERQRQERIEKERREKEERERERKEREQRAKEQRERERREREQKAREEREQRQREEEMKRNNSEKKPDTAYITKALMNKCRLGMVDLSNILLDKDGIFNGELENSTFYVRVPSPKSDNEYRVSVVTKVTDRRAYAFNNQQITKALQISFGKSVTNKKFNAISCEDFTLAEIHEWLFKMRKQDCPLPSKEDLINGGESIEILREIYTFERTKFAKQGKSSKEKPITTPMQPGSAPPGFGNNDMNGNGNGNGSGGDHSSTVPLSADALVTHEQETEQGQQALLLKQYMDAIQGGYTYFWCIPSMNTEEESYYLVLQLMKHSANAPILEEVKAWVKGVNEEITFVEIREWTKHAKKKGKPLRAKGLLFDCRNKNDVWTVFSYLHKEIVPRSYPVSLGGKHKNVKTNFVRYVNGVFAAEYMRVQSMENKPRPLHKLAKKPQGPDFDYVKYGGEPSLATMSEAPSVRGKERFGEWDHSLCGSIHGNDETMSQDSSASSRNSSLSAKSHKNATKHGQNQNIPEGVVRNNIGFKSNDQVRYKGKIYDVVIIHDNESRIENDEGSMLVSNSKLQKVVSN